MRRNVIVAGAAIIAMATFAALGLLVIGPFGGGDEEQPMEEVEPAATAGE